MLNSLRLGRLSNIDIDINHHSELRSSHSLVHDDVDGNVNVIPGSEGAGADRTTLRNTKNLNDTEATTNCRITNLSVRPTANPNPNSSPNPNPNRSALNDGIIGTLSSSSPVDHRSISKSNTEANTNSGVISEPTNPTTNTTSSVHIHTHPHVLSHIVETTTTPNHNHIHHPRTIISPIKTATTLSSPPIQTQQSSFSIHPTGSTYSNNSHSTNSYSNNSYSYSSSDDEDDEEEDMIELRNLNVVEHHVSFDYDSSSDSDS
ncbi:unnamed protein product [Ambrosiozyma monospora]|uniref:Unnamed protein product n=1 Tax=Ambrosiozyma monospora TaxID=43982 RepID=A0A9W6Z761_AMBMO|nr:unnamed protein product [Ambrosiozyma monospora]